MMFVRALLGLALVCIVITQKVGTQQAEFHMPINWQNCSSLGICATVNGALVIDANWRWLHQSDANQNCFTGGWNCGSSATCTTNCYLEGISEAQWASPYGISSLNCGSGIKMNYVTQGQYGTNYGGRVYLLASTSASSDYQTFKLLNREFAFDVDTSQLQCGLNGAVYFVQMDKDGGKAKYNATNKAGAPYGVGYCDAQCPKDIKYIQGVANAEGTYGTCCAEIDLWQANKWANAFTAHPCNTTGNYKCNGTACDTQCDKAGCDINPYRNGNKTFYGPSTTSTKFTLDTTQPFTVVTRFYTNNSLDNGTLLNITRYYIQNGKKFDNPQNNYSSVTSPKYSHISDTSCKNEMAYFNATNTFASHGGMARLNTSLTNGVVLVLSLWDDNFAKMLWLDSVYPVGGSTTTPGNLRGPCPTSSGDPNTLRNSVPNSYVKYSNIKFGKIGTTY